MATDNPFELLSQNQGIPTAPSPSPATPRRSRPPGSRVRTGLRIREIPDGDGAAGPVGNRRYARLRQTTPGRVEHALLLPRRRSQILRPILLQRYRSRYFLPAPRQRKVRLLRPLILPIPLPRILSPHYLKAMPYLQVRCAH